MEKYAAKETDTGAIVKPYLFKASLVAALAMLLGISLSFIVYFSTTDVRNNAVLLVEHRIPTLRAINQIIADLSEQERIIHLYYANQASDDFWQAFNTNKQLLQMHSARLTREVNLADDISQLMRQQQMLEAEVARFDKIMQSAQRDWDLLREVLARISDIRQTLLPTLLAMEKSTKAAVNISHQQTLTKMANTHSMVLFYAIALIGFAMIGAWYIRRYILTTAENTRLALFSQQNPNPIISTDHTGQIVYSNPACQQLLLQAGACTENISLLLPSDFDELTQQLRGGADVSLSVERVFHHQILQCNINWHPNIDAYDIHIIDITERKKAEQDIERLAYFVQETQLPNHYKFNLAMQALINAKQPFSLTVFEIAKFSQLLTSSGIQTSNRVVVSLAKIIAKNLPQEVDLYQLNDHQFSLLSQRYLNQESITKLCEKISLFTQKPIPTDDGDFFVELDFGVSMILLEDETSDSVLKEALSALVWANEKEHNNIAFYQLEYASRVKNNNELLTQLRSALDNNALFLVFQPQFDLNKQQITGLETLVRWRGENGLVSPAEFIPLAEQSGLIVPIGTWILQQACQFTAQLIAQGYTELVVAINISPRQFSHPDFFNTVINTLAHYQLPAKNIELEITEGMFINNEEQMVALLTKLHNVGLKLSIDDFGTGYSSLSYLKRFPVDKLKIDQSFIRDCHNNDEDKAIVKTIIALGKSLGLSLIAEGVEEEAHVDFLTQIQCDEIQGYWYAKPLEPQALCDFLAEKKP